MQPSPETRSDLAQVMMGVLQASVAAILAGLGSQSGIVKGLQTRCRVVGHRVKVGGVVSTTVTVWLQVLLWPHGSMACQVRVMACGQRPLVTVLRIVTARFAPLQVSLAAGESKLQAVPQMTVLLALQVKVGEAGTPFRIVWFPESAT